MEEEPSDIVVTSAVVIVLSVVVMSCLVVKGCVVLIPARVDASSFLEEVVCNAVIVLSSPAMILQIIKYVLLLSLLH